MFAVTKNIDYKKRDRNDLNHQIELIIHCHYTFIDSPLYLDAIGTYLAKDFVTSLKYSYVFMRNL